MRKTQLFLLCLLAMSLAFGFQSCKKDKDDSPATSTENTTGNGGQNNQNGGGNSEDNNNDKTDPVAPTFSFSEKLNSENKTVESGAELELKIGNLTAESVVSAFLDGEEIKVENGVIILPTTTVGEHKVKVIVNNDEKEFTFKVLLPALEIKTCALSSEETEFEINAELKLNLEANNPCTITVKVNGNAIEAKDGVYVLPTDKLGEFAVSVEFNDGQNEAKTETLSYKVTKQPIESEEITVKGVTFKMNKVYGGTFQMGATAEQGTDAYDDEKPTHEVTLSSYSIGQTEVTQALWKAVMGDLPSQIASNPYAIQGDDKPVVYVSWDDIQTFLSKLNELTPGKTFRLPTEAEWEFAARGGINSKGYKYSGTTEEFGDYAWYWDNCAVDGKNGSHAVATRKANELGLYDMSGNVWEWCQDWYGGYSEGSQTNPTGPDTGSDRVFRGGGWNSFARYCRVSLRIYNSPFNWDNFIGFRLAL